MGSGDARFGDISRMMSGVLILSQKFGPSSNPCRPMCRGIVLAHLRTAVLHTHIDTWVMEDGIVRVQPTSGNKPPSISMCCCVALGDDLIVFGGSSKDQRIYADVYALSTLTWKWRKLDAQGTPPAARAGGSACAINETACMVCCGGGIEDDEYNEGKGLKSFSDCYILSVVDDKAYWIRYDDALPNGRVAASLDTLNGRLLLHGGWNPEMMETMMNRFYYAFESNNCFFF